MKDVSMGVWRTRTRIGLGFSIVMASVFAQVLQWLHGSVAG
jgi:hypothetical protein